MTASTDSRLSVVTMPADNDEAALVDPCTGGYLCQCAGCDLDRAQFVARGVRPSLPLPLKRAA